MSIIKFKTEKKNEETVEYAEQYPKNERIRIILLMMLAATFIVITHEKWVFPFIGWYARTAHCHTPLGFSGISVLWHSVLVGLPLFCALIIGVFTMPIGIKGLKDKQFPPKGMKVLKPTKILKGWKGTFKSVGHIIVPTIMVGIAVWGYFQVDTMPHEPPKDIDYSICEMELWPK
ncbi:hypothetical protein [Colwellia sp. E2M01]|uniref:hypothetical protein n=1 Tax=Colwellia sp. E2M01 TaxID=2841561 RepID=UPI001C08A6D9|nr:hypothetical protein [Colwellia sp. E2M01]MBU2871122.1 hypothetical protein [Colwellia sp. E2M01]